MKVSLAFVILSVLGIIKAILGDFSIGNVILLLASIICLFLTVVVYFYLKSSKSDMAMVQAAKTRGDYYSYDNVYVVGASYLDDRSSIKEAEDGDRVEFVFEPKNEYDNKAVRVDDMQGRKLGYIGQDNTVKFMIHDFTNDGGIVRGRIDSVSTKGVTLQIEFIRGATREEKRHANL